MSELSCSCLSRDRRIASEGPRQPRDGRSEPAITQAPAPIDVPSPLSARVVCSTRTAVPELERAARSYEPHSRRTCVQKGSIRSQPHPPPADHFAQQG